MADLALWLSFARVTGALSSLHLRDDLTEIVALCLLKGRVRDVGLQVLEPKLLAYGKHIPVILEGRDRTPKRAPQRHRALLLGPNRSLERIAFDVLDQGEVERNEWQNPACRPGLRHCVVHLPILVANRRRRSSGKIEEVIPSRFVRLALQIVALVEAIQGRLNNAGILASFDLFV